MYDDLVYQINGCLFAVYNSLGNVWYEETYENAVMLELQAQGLKAERQKEFQVFYCDRQVGKYRLDVLVNDRIIIELKATPAILPLHKAQLISYLKGYHKPLGLLANFGGSPLEYQIFPNKVNQLTVLEDSFDFEKYRHPAKERIRDLLLICQRILVTLGPGYLHQVYRRALFYELRLAKVEVGFIKEAVAEYRQRVVGRRDVYFLRVRDLLISAVAVNELTDELLAKFRNYIKHLRCQRGFIINFRALHLDFRYYEL